MEEWVVDDRRSGRFSEAAQAVHRPVLAVPPRQTCTPSTGSIRGHAGGELNAGWVRPRERLFGTPAGRFRDAQ